MSTFPLTRKFRDAKQGDERALVDWLTEALRASSTPADANDDEPAPEVAPTAPPTRSHPASQVTPIILVAVAIVTGLANWPIPGGFLGFPFAVAGSWYQQLPLPPTEVETIRTTARPLLLPAFALALVATLATTRLLGLGGTFTRRSIKSPGARVVVVTEFVVVVGLILVRFLVGFGFTPPDRRVHMNDFRWDVVWLISGSIGGAALLVVGIGMGRCERWLRARKG